MAADLGKASARQDEGVPRPRGGAHAASKNVRLRRGASGPVPPPAIPSPRRTVPGGTAAALAALAARLEPAAIRGPVDRLAAARSKPVRPAVAGLVAAAVVVTVIPLVLVQVPDAIAWSLPARFAHGGPNTLASLLLAAGAVQLHAFADARTAPAVHAALVAGASRWALAAAVVTAAAGLALACASGRRASSGTRDTVYDAARDTARAGAGAPVPRAVGTPDRG